MDKFRMPTWLARLPKEVARLSKQLPRLPKDFELRAVQGAAAFSALLVVILVGSLWWSHRGDQTHTPDLEIPVFATTTPEPATHYPAIKPDAGVIEPMEVPPTLTLEPTSVPSPMATVTEAPKKAYDPASEYPELVARVDQAVQTASFSPLPVMRTSDGYQFRWDTHFSPPALIGIKGGEVYAPYKLPYRFTHTFKIRALDENAERKLIVKAINTNGKVEIKDSDLPPGKYEWTVSGWLHTRPYDNMTAWLAWQPFEVTR